MKAITQDRYGSADVLEVRDVEPPMVGPSDVLVQVRAASVNAADWRIMRGMPQAFRGVGLAMGFGLRGPTARIRGTDAAGTVAAVGAHVTTLRPGDAVVGSADGSFAEFALADESAWIPKPGNLSFDQAAAIPMAGVTALQGIRDHGRVGSAMSVLINGAAGGVGTFAVQIARALGAEVTGVCSTRNVELVRSIGADHVIDYTREDFADGGRRFDLILDLVGNRTLAERRRALKPGGLLLLSHGSGGRWFGPIGEIVRAMATSPFTDVTMRPFVATSPRKDLLALSELITAGTVCPVIDRTYPLGEAAEAVRYVEQGHARGKVIITVYEG